MRPMVQANCFLAFGIIIAVISIAMMASFNAIYKTVLNNMLVIDPDNKIFDTYTHPEVPLYLDIYFFNVTNPEEIVRFGATPRVTEVGPYKYMEVMEKFDDSFDHEAGTYKYRQKTTYFFDKDLSNGTEDDVIMTLNPVLLIIADKLEKLPEAVKAFGEIIFIRFIMWDEVFITRKVSELLFKGYFDPFVELSGKLFGDPEKSTGKFGYYRTSNGSNDGLYEVFTGEKSMDNYLFVNTWNEQSELDYWGYNGTQDDPYCNMINGTDGTQFPPGVQKDRLVQIFVTDLCRSIDFVFESEVKVLDIVDSLRFIAPEEMLESGHTYENNLCYCVPIPDQKDPCLDDAMLNLSPCLGVPIVLSTPHFYEGDKEDIDSVIGLNPTKEKHETFLDIEPTTGVVMRGSKRIQLNLPLKQYGGLSTFKNVPELIFPILWVDENAVIPEDDANDLNDALTIPYLIIYIIFGITLIIATIFIIIGAILRERTKKNKKAGLLVH